MNVNDDNTEPPLTNLRLSLGLSSQFRQRRLSSDSLSGAGANATSAVEMAFVATDPLLSELVWSPRKGLRLKCARSSLNPRRSFLFGKDNSDKKSMSGNSLNLKNQVGESSHRPIEGRDCYTGKFEAPVLDIVGVLGDGKEKEECLQVNLNTMEEGDRTHGTRDAGSNDRKLDVENELESETNASKQCKVSDTVEAAPKYNNLISQSPTSSRIQRYRRKGKEKALSDGSLNTTPPHKNNRDDEDSHESVESCNSIGFCSKGKKKREGDDQQLSNESKRHKPNHDSLGSTTFVPKGSSFVCWISNMMKAFPKSNQETEPLALTLAQSSHGWQETRENQITPPKKDNDREYTNTGFQNMFKLISSRNTKARGEVGMSDSVCDVNATPLTFIAPSDVFSEQPLLANEQYNQSTTPRSGADSSTKSKDEKVLCNLGSDANKNGVSPACSSLGKRKATGDNSNDCNPRTDPLGSLWITRFSHKSSCPSQMTNPRFLEGVDSPKERNLVAAVDSGENPTSANKTEASVGLLRGVKTGNKLKSSEAMSSIFARRLDAFKHILPSNTTRSMTCFFCGKKGHDLKNCLEITELELDDLIKNVHSYDGAEESPRLCIKCFQLNHWAVSCPNVSSKGEQLEECGAPTSLKDKVSQSEIGRDNSAEKPVQVKNFVVSSIQEIGQKENPNTFSTYKFADDRQSADVLKGFFDAPKRLRLSRTNVLKWMNSQIPLSHIDGFYLRLRLGTWEEGLGRTGYYVGCINGAHGENLPKGSQSAIPVSIGSGMKCLVESKYVSNHDFLEDELAAWWSLTFKSGGYIPSEGDIEQKVEARKKLGL